MIKLFFKHFLIWTETPLGIEGGKERLDKDFKLIIRLVLRLRLSLSLLLFPVYSIFKGY